MKNVQITITGMGVGTSGMVEDVADTLRRAGARVSIDWGAVIPPEGASAITSRTLQDAILEIRVNPPPANIAAAVTPIVQETIAQQHTPSVTLDDAQAAQQNITSVEIVDGITEMVRRDLNENGVEMPSVVTLAPNWEAAHSTALLCGDATAKIELMFRRARHRSFTIDDLPELARHAAQAQYHLSSLMLQYGIPLADILEGSIAAEKYGYDFNPETIFEQDMTEPVAPTNLPDALDEIARLRAELAAQPVF